MKNLVIFLIHDEDSWPMYLGSFSYKGKIHSSTVIKELFEQNPQLCSLLEEYEAEDECHFQVVKETQGTFHFTKEINYENANVIMEAGEIIGYESENTTDTE